LSGVSHCVFILLSYIYNLSLETGIVPNKFKIAKVIPIFKKGNTELPNNYRPISLLSIFDKILEKIIASRLLLFWNNHNIFNANQFGFRAGHSTTLAFINILDEVFQILERGDMSLAIFFDIQKAFDTVDHSILLY